MAIIEKEVRAAYDVETKVPAYAVLGQPRPIEATCAACGDQCVVPADEDPENTLCAICADDEQTS